MKIIDLLNKIANGEEVPNRFIYNGCLYENYQNGCYRYYDYEAGKYTNIIDFVSKICDDFCNLNDEIEIPEEHNEAPQQHKIEKLRTWYSLEKNCEDDNIVYANVNFEKMYEKINEIIDYLEQLKSKGE